jgi:hypothetical protein
MAISFLRNMDCFFHPLTGPAGETPAWAASGSLNFDLDSVPAIDRSGKAVYIAGIALEINGTWDLSNTAGATVVSREMTRCFIDSISMQNASMGTPLGAESIKGHRLNAIEWLSLAGTFWQGYRLQYPVASSYAGESHQIFVPLMHGGLLKSHHTAQLALLYKRARLNLRCGLGLAALDAQNTEASTTVRAYAVCFSESEIRLGPVAEWLSQEVSVVSGSEVVELKNFGRNTNLQNMNEGAALLNLLWLDSGSGQGGAGLVESITRLYWPEEMTAPLYSARPLLRRMDAQFGIAAAWGRDPLSDTIGSDAHDGPYPYPCGVAGAGVDSDTVGFPTFLPLKLSAPEQEIIKLRVIGGTENIQMTGTFSGTHVFLMQQLKQWKPSMFEQIKAEIDRVGLAEAVNGFKAADSEWVTKTARKQQGGLRPEKELFLPVKLVPRAALAA